jgi:RNA polymerase sigma-70 factor, ECF subfamily
LEFELRKRPALSCGAGGTALDEERFLNFRRNLSALRRFMLLRTRNEGNPLKAPKKEADERLLIEAAQKDPSRFAELYDDNFERVYAYIARRVHDRSAAEDLTSEVFHQAFTNLGQFEWRGVRFAAWLLRIAANAVVDRWKRAAKEQGSPAADEPDAGEIDLEEVEQRARLFRLVKRLPTDQRRVIEMRFSEEKSIREIAQELKRSEGAVKQLQFRALQNLRARMGEANG